MKHLLRHLDFEADLLEDADEELVDVVLHPAGGFDVLAVEGGGQRFAGCGRVVGKKEEKFGYY